MGATATETTDEQQIQAQKGTISYTRSWKVVVDDQGADLVQIQQACGGVATGQAGPFGTVCSAVRLQGTDSRYLYKVQAEYSKPDVLANNPLDEADVISWSFASTTAPALIALSGKTSTTYNKPIVNSAGDPLENVTMEVAEAHLKISGNRATFPAGTALGYVNAVNSDSYAGGAPGTWKCQGIEATSATAELDDGAGGSYTLNYWKISADLAYRAQGWALKLLDVGFNEITGDGKVKIAVPRVNAGAGNDEKLRNALREQHAAADVQALNNNGTAKAAGEPPDILTFYVYIEKPFAGVFPSPT